MQAEIAEFAAANPGLERIEVFISDLNGVLRGKWLPGEQIDKLDGGVRFPISTSALDIWGHDVEGTGLGISDGDKDGICVPVPGTLRLVPWNRVKSAQVLMQLVYADGSVNPYDGRAVLAAILDRYRAAGLTPVVATELEFFLLDKQESAREPFEPPEPCRESHLLDFTPMHAFETVLMEIESACRAQNLPSDTFIAESGRGQFEVNFNHTSDALAAADTAVLFRRLVRGVAGRHGLSATFMAKPYGDDAGSGMHVHCSILDSAGNNIFDGDGAEPNPRLSHAIGGVLRSLGPLQLIFAPHLNSYRRFDMEGFAPTRINWGHDHRAAAVRVPETRGKAARFEHRVAGADANPYLVIAAILAGALEGLETEADPGPSIEEGGREGMGTLTHDWLRAVERFEGTVRTADLVGEDFSRVFGLIKRFEIMEFMRRVTDVERATYLGRI